MIKQAKLSLSALLLLGLWSCASNEPVAEEIKTFEGNEAIMRINIYASTDDTRADGTSSASYTNGTDDENVVTELNFYFYDRAGEYVTCKENVKYTEVKNPDGTNASTGSMLVEEIGTSRIVLTDLLGKNYPSYVVAVLNYTPSSSSDQQNRFKKPLSEIRNEVRTTNAWNLTNGKVTKFVMTSATHSKNSEDFYYFATPITEENFALQEEGSAVGDEWDQATLGAKPVDIYVERLAAKVEIKFPGYTPVDAGNGKIYYEKVLADSYTLDEGLTADNGTPLTATKMLKVRVLGWGVNGQAKTTKYFKAVNDNPNPFRTTDGWDYNGTNRCYWAKTPGYGSNTYSSSFDDVDDKSSNGVGEDDDAAVEEPLWYISWDDVVDNGLVNKIAYVMPHTEEGAQINLTGNQIHHSALTEILVAAQILDENDNPVTLFQLDKSYYTKEGVINYLLNAAGNHIWKKAEDNKYVTIEPEDVEVVYGYDGTFSINVKSTDVFYMDNEGTTQWTDNNAVAAEINAYLPQNLTFCYNNGMTYYNIPIKHLRTYVPDQEIKTGMFGVVRNHWYQVSIGDIKSLGHSVYRGSEHIIPPSDETRYMLGSSIKILSWRIVPSTAEL